MSLYVLQGRFSHVHSQTNLVWAHRDGSGSYLYGLLVNPYDSHECFTFTWSSDPSGVLGVSCAFWPGKLIEYMGINCHQIGTCSSGDNLSLSCITITLCNN